MIVGTALRSWASFLVLLASSHDEVIHPKLFGYKIGQTYEVSESTERRLSGVIVADPAELMDGLEEVLLTVAPKTHTIIGIRGTVRVDDGNRMEKLRDQYWKLLTAQFVEWESHRSPIGSIYFYKPPYWLHAKTQRTRTGVEFSVSLEYSPGTPERRALNSLRRRETRQIIVDYQSGGL